MNTPSEKIATPDHEVLDVFAERWSPRAFADRPVEPETLRRIFEAARWTMSSYNEQPWRYVVATKDDTEAYDRLLGCLNEFNQQWAQTAPVLMLSFAKKTFSRDGSPNRCSLHDVGAASAALTFQATDLGLYVHQMAGIHRSLAEDTYNVPDDFEAMAGLALGYLGSPDQLPDDMQAGETAPRSRKPLSEVVFADDWETPASWVDDDANGDAV